MNKLSELSKPVAYIADCGTIVSDSDPFFDDYKNPAPLYSQEYVFALQEDAHISKRYALIAENRLKECRARIAELEAKLVTLKNEFGELWKGNVDLLARLATPVRLPGALIPAVHASGEPFMRPEPFGFYLNRDDVIKKLRAAGFTVEGDQ